MFLVNGESRTHIEITDRGFQYGDGLFETIKVINKRPAFVDLHLSRLQSGCRRLYIPLPDFQILIFEAETLCKQFCTDSLAVLKLIITRGSGGRGYRQPDLIQPTRILSLHPFPDYPLSYQTEGIIARFCDTQLGLNPVLAGIKHLNRLEQVLARAEWCHSSIQEGIMLDVNHHVIEGTMTNLFYIKNNTLYTAELTSSGVAGIMRTIIMTLSSLKGLDVVEHVFTKNELLCADEIFFSNSIIGIWPVKQIETHYFSVGPITRQIQLWIDDIKYETFSVD